jgi:hypothetical protein
MMQNDRVRRGWATELKKLNVKMNAARELVERFGVDPDEIEIASIISTLRAAATKIGCSPAALASTLLGMPKELDMCQLASWLKISLADFQSGVGDNSEDGYEN